MKKACIYLISNPNGPFYIGQTRNFERRKQDLDNGSVMYKHPLIWCSYMLFGFGYHTFTVLHELPWDVSNEVLNTYERFYIDQYKECGIKLVNIREGGIDGRVHADTKVKMRAAQLGVKNSQARLTAADVVAIREEARNTPQVKIAAKYGVSASAIGLILSGKRWGHV